MAHENAEGSMLMQCRAEFDRAVAACFAGIDEQEEGVLWRLHQAGNAAENYRQALFTAAQETRQAHGEDFRRTAQDLAAQVQFLMRAVFVIRKKTLRHRRLV